jgi:hypothetical protein
MLTSAFGHAWRVPTACETGDSRVRIETPRDRAGRFEPLLLPKHTRRFTVLGSSPQQIAVIVIYHFRDPWEKKMISLPGKTSGKRPWLGGTDLTPKPFP